MTVKTGAPFVFGGFADDSQEGTDLGDVFVGGFGWTGDVGDDSVAGYGGDDTILGSDGNNTFDGGDGSDLVDYSAAGSAVTIHLGNGTAALDLVVVGEILMSNKDKLISIERVRGTGFDDSIVGSSADNVLAGGAGNDTLDGGLGIDTASYADATAGVNASLLTGGATSVDGDDHLRNFENLAGSSFADVLTGDGGNNLLDGGDGNDLLSGGAGNDTLIGGMGNDVAVFSGKQSDYAITTQPDGRIVVSDLRPGADGTDMLAGIRQLQFSDGTLTLTGLDRLVAEGAQAQSVTGLADGSYVIAWQAADASGSGVFFRQFDANGMPLGAATQINTATAGNQAAPAVTALYDGGWVAVYQSATGSGWDIALQRFNADGSRNGAEVALGGAGDQTAPSVTATIDGGFAVTWQAAGDVRVARFGWDGAAQPDVIVNTATEGSQGAAAVAEQDNGYMVAWQSDNGTSHGVLVQQYRWDGEAVGAEVKLATTGVVGSVGIAALYGAGGTAIAGTAVAWIQDDGNTATSDDAVMVQRFDAAGTRAGMPITVASTGFQHEAAVTGLRDGGFIVVWDNVATDGTTTVMGRHYNANGSAAGAAWQVNQVAVTGTVSAPTVAEAADGHVVVSWTTTGSDGAARVWQQLIDQDGAAEFVASSSSGQPPAAPQFTVQAAGIVTPTASAAMMAGRIAPGAAEALVIDEGKFTTGDLLVTGTGDAGASITLYDAGAKVAKVTANASGNWSVQLADLDSGAHRFSAVAVDALGQVSSTSKIVTLVVVGTLEGTSGNDNEAYFAGAGANGTDQTISAGEGNDTINGGGGADTLEGGAGNDTYIVTNEGVVVVEQTGGGIDTVATSLSSYTLGAGVENLQRTGTASFTGTGNALDNDIAGSSGADVLDGGAGNDTLRGNGGTDSLSGGAGNDTLYVGAGTAVANGGEGTDTLYLAQAIGTYTIAGTGSELTLTGQDGAIVTARNVEYFVFDGGQAVSVAALTAPANQSLTGTTKADELTGGAGNDTLDGGRGADKLAGGAGDDTYIVDVTGDKVIELAGAGRDTVETSASTLTLAANVENLVYKGSAKATLTGNAEANDIVNGNGGGKLAGLAGDDTLTGGTGSDSLAGGDGDDVLRAGGGVGSDTLDGGAGDDTAVLEGERAAWSVTRSAENGLLLTKGKAKVAVRDVEHFTFADGTVAFDTLAVSTKPTNWGDSLTGTAGNETLNGGAGADTMAGLAGNDVYVVDNKDDVVIEAAGGGSDTVQVAIATANSTWVLADNVEHGTVTSKAAVNVTGNGTANILTGNAAANTLAGLDGDDTLAGGSGNDRLDGGNGNDLLDGGAGSDTMTGGAGDDVYTVDAAGDLVVELADGGTDTVRTALTKYALTGHVEKLVFTGTAAFTGTGNDVENVITGGRGKDILSGGAGNDTLSGNAGDDALTGGAGDDVFVLDLASHDKVADFAVDQDLIAFSTAGLSLGGGGIVRGAATNGFSADADLVVFDVNAKKLDVANAATAIGSATGNYAKGDVAFFAIDNGESTAVFMFKSSGIDALVTSKELTQVATLTGVKDASLVDFDLHFAL